MLKKILREPICLFNEIYKNYNMVVDLSKHELKREYSGTILGMFWAVAKPIMTLIVYWFVFSIGLRSGSPIKGVPFFLWLMAGMSPWFFISDTLVKAANSIRSKSYLVKKMVFPVSILPTIKVISLLYGHLLFVVIMIIVFALYGYFPDLYYLELIYYIFSEVMLMIAISWATSSLVVFSKDIYEFLRTTIVLFFWLTPIVWSIDNLPPFYKKIFLLNPFYYNINGFRNALINKIWFWEQWKYGLYYWSLIAILLTIGAIIHNKLRTHFADIL